MRANNISIEESYRKLCELSGIAGVREAIECIRIICEENELKFIPISILVYKGVYTLSILVKYKFYVNICLNSVDLFKSTVRTAKNLGESYCGPTIFCKYVGSNRVYINKRAIEIFIMNGVNNYGMLGNMKKAIDEVDENTEYIFE